MSLEFRRRLYLWLRTGTEVYVFDTRLGIPLSIRNKAGIVGVRTSPHTLTHTFACVYLKSGGNLEPKADLGPFVNSDHSTLPPEYSA
jgi:integrase